jgi:hypothetical protein
MKVMGILLFVFILALSVILAMDILLGFKFNQIVPRLLNPLNVMDAGEYVIIAFVLLLIIGQQIIFYYKNKADKHKNPS